MNCGYDLYGLHVSGRCPECGSLVVHTLEQRQIQPHVTDERRVRLSMRILVVLVLCLFIVNIATCAAAGRGVPLTDVAILAIVVLWLVTFGCGLVVLVKTVNARQRSADSVATIVVLLVIAALAIAADVLFVIFASLHM